MNSFLLKIEKLFVYFFYTNYLEPQVSIKLGTEVSIFKWEVLNHL
jgi:hypothetical protein